MIFIYVIFLFSIINQPQNYKFILKYGDFSQQSENKFISFKKSRCLGGFCCKKTFD
jgi:hypothetical protein